MKVIICGAGQVGSGIAKRLSSENNDVTVIDISQELVRNISESADVHGIVGHGAYPDVLERAGASGADMIIAVTYADEVNMTACHVAHTLFNVPLKIARVRAQPYLEQKYGDLFNNKRLPIDVIISPELEVGKSVMRRLDVPGAFDTLGFAGGLVQFVGTHIDESCPVVNVPLKQLTELFPDLLAVTVGIVRDGKLFVPRGTDHMQVGDDIFFIADSNHVARTLDILGHQEKGARRIIIVGGGNIGLYVAKELERRGSSLKVKLIEHNKARAEVIADQLTRTVVLHGDGLDQEMLKEARVEENEAVIAVTNDDEVNILASVLAKRAGCRRSLALINNANYVPLVRSLGIDAYIDPKATTVSTILQHIRRGKIRGLHSVHEGQGEVLEAEALQTSPLVGRPIRECRIPDGIMFGAIVRDKKVVRPGGDTVIEVGDRVILFARNDMIRKVEQLFRVSLEYF